MQRKSIIISLSLMGLAFMIAVGCSSENGTMPETSLVVTKSFDNIPNEAPAANDTTLNDIESKETGSVASKPDIDDAPEDIEELYNPIGRINPFVPLFRESQITAIGKSKKKKRRIGHLTPLEKADLSQMKLLGTILASSGHRALVTDASGKGYVVKLGTYMGIASGRVIEILKDRIIVEEEVENILGKISLRKRELKLQKPPGEF